MQKKFRDKFRKNVDKIIQIVVFVVFKIKKMFNRRSNQKNANRTFEINFNFVFYNFIFFVFVNLQFRQTKRQFARFVNRVFSFFQSLFQKNNDDDNFDDFFFIRSYANFVDHESNHESKHVSNNENDEKKKSRLFNKKDKKTYAKKIVKQRVRIRKIDFKIRRDDKNLNFDYMIARKKNVIFDKYVLSKFQIKKNACFFCNVYQYDEKCHRKFIDDKY